MNWMLLFLKTKEGLLLAPYALRAATMLLRLQKNIKKVAGWG